MTPEDVSHLVDRSADDLEGALRPLLHLVDANGRLPAGWLSVAKRLTGANAADLVCAWSGVRPSRD